METEVRVTVESTPASVEVAAPEPVELLPPAPPVIARNAPEIPRVSLELPPNSDLVLVETSHAKPTAPEEEPTPPRARRVRPPRVEVAEEPLQMIETTHKDPNPPDA
jgi:hypothetical protein